MLRADVPATSHFRFPKPYRTREAELGSPSKSATSRTSETVILLNFSVRGGFGGSLAVHNVTCEHARWHTGTTGESNPMPRLDQMFCHWAPHDAQTDETDVQRTFPLLSTARDLGGVDDCAVVL